LSNLWHLPKEVIELVRSAAVLEFATVSAAGYPIDTPTYCFTPDDFTSIDVATGLAYPAKAERARRNPKVGLLIEGRAPGEPLVAIAGLAAVRDSNIQGNASRYIEETSTSAAVDVPWSIARKAIWYWCRIIISVTPVRVLWWPDGVRLGEAPCAWSAPAGMSFPASDLAPLGAVSPAPNWSQPAWPELAASALTSGMAGHLTSVDAEGFPLPFRVADISHTDDGFIFRVPAGAPWDRPGKATLSFEGRATFVGVAAERGAWMTFAVERALPILPMVADHSELWEPSEATRDKLMRRLSYELDRRGQSFPEIPQEKPTPTAGAVRRMARLASLTARRSR
jgi:hypothetical protein